MSAASSVVECVANVSEGRDTAVVGAMAVALRSTDARLLDVHTDPDHHRTVFTLAGSLQPIERGTLALARECVARIDLRRHTGVHPRMGALDVLPFVPLYGVSMPDCAALARNVGATIAAELSVPVYLYGEAALRPERRSLRFVRGQGFEALEERMAGEGFLPDFGPCHPHPSAGATAVGARNPLVAYNVRLGTTDIAVARRIARSIRETGGGMRGVQALGFPLATCGCVQVSMNLTGPKIPRVSDVFEQVRDAARSLGVAIKGSELVGLAPRAALAGATRQKLMLDDEPADHVLEVRLVEAGLP